MTVQTKYTFGDRVAFASNSQGAMTVGKVAAIHVEENQPMSYLVEIDKGWYSDVEDVTEGLLGPVDNEVGRETRHLLSFQSRFAFGDRVRFDSAIQNCHGTGTVVGMTIDSQSELTYMVKIPDQPCPNVQPGILEQEIALWGAEQEC